MGDRAQRIKGKAEEIKGATKREAGAASGRPGAEAKGAALRATRADQDR